jgi:hypothetical protein
MYYMQYLRSYSKLIHYCKPSRNLSTRQSPSNQSCSNISWIAVNYSADPRYKTLAASSTPRSHESATTSCNATQQQHWSIFPQNNNVTPSAAHISTTPPTGPLKRGTRSRPTLPHACHDHMYRPPVAGLLETLAEVSKPAHSTYPKWDIKLIRAL